MIDRDRIPVFRNDEQQQEQRQPWKNMAHIPHWPVDAKAQRSNDQVRAKKIQDGVFKKSGN